MKLLFSMLATISVIALLALPAVADEPSDCNRWKIEEFGPDMELLDAFSMREFAEQTKHRDPLGYARFLSGSQKTGGVEIHADIAAKPQRVIGVTLIGPSVTRPELIERWGEPRHDQVKANFRILSWWDDTCGVSARANVEAGKPDVILAVSMSKNAARSEYLRRKREAAENPSADSPAEPADPAK